MEEIQKQTQTPVGIYYRVIDTSDQQGKFYWNFGLDMSLCGGLSYIL